MTLIILYANEQYAYVAADRRLTYPDLSIAENDRTKLLACYQGLVFGFTGRAFLKRDGEIVSAPMWLAHTMREQEGSDWLDFDRIAAQLTQTRMGPGGKRLAFGAVGFVSGNPTSVLVSNMHDDEGSPLLRARDQYKAFVNSFSGHFFCTLGGQLSAEAHAMLRERMPVASSNPKAVPQLLAGAIERSTGRTIGKQSLVTTMQRNPPPGEDSILCETVTPGWRGPRPISDAAMPVFLGAGGFIAAVQHSHRDWPNGWT